MSIVRDDGDERQTHLDRMIEEFRNAQSRRRARVAAVNVETRAVDVDCDAGDLAAVVESTLTPPSRSNG